MATTTEGTTLTKQERNELRKEKRRVQATLGEIEEKLGEAPPKEHKVRNAFRAFGRGVIDTDLRDVGHAVRAIPSKLPRIEVQGKDEEPVVEVIDPT